MKTPGDFIINIMGVKCSSCENKGELAKKSVTKDQAIDHFFKLGWQFHKGKWLCPMCESVAYMED